MLVTYYSGASQALLERNVIVPGKTKFAGLSGGGYSAAGMALGLSGTELRDVWKVFINETLNRYSDVIGHFGSNLVAAIGPHFPEDAHRRVAGRLRIAISQLNGNQNKTLNDSATWQVDSFKSKLDLIAALAATTYIPCTSGMTSFTTFRNQPVVDGGYSSAFPQLCKTPDKCLRIATYVVGPLVNETCDPVKCPDASMCKGTNASSPGRDDTITKLYRNGKYVDQWPLNVLRERCPTQAWPGEPPSPMPLWVAQEHGMMPHIHPGQYNNLPEWDGQPLLGCQWRSWAMTPGPPADRMMEAMEVIYQAGYNDAMGWYNATH